MITTKHCRRCGQEKPLDEMARDRAKPGGYATICRSCNAARSRDYYTANRERVNERTRAYHALHRTHQNAARMARSRPGEIVRRAALRHAIGTRLLPLLDILGFAVGIVCGRCHAAEATQIDHIVPFIAGGSDAPGNIRLACERCQHLPPDDPAQATTIADQLASFMPRPLAEALIAWAWHRPGPGRPSRRGPLWEQAQAAISAAGLPEPDPRRPLGRMSLREFNERP